MSNELLTQKLKALRARLPSGWYPDLDAIIDLSEKEQGFTAPWISVKDALPVGLRRVEVRDDQGQVGLAETSWVGFTVHKGVVVHTLPQWGGWLVMANADLRPSVTGAITHWRLPATHGADHKPQQGADTAELDAIRKLLAWPRPTTVLEAVTLLHEKYSRQCDTLQRAINDLGIEGHGGEAVAKVIVDHATKCKACTAVVDELVKAGDALADASERLTIACEGQMAVSPSLVLDELIAPRIHWDAAKAKLTS